MVAVVSRVPRARAVELLDQTIRGLQRTERLCPVTVIVPSARSAIQLPRRLVAVRSLRSEAGEAVGLVNVNFVTLARLAQALGAPRLEVAGRRRLTRTMLAAAVRGALAAGATMFGPLTAHPATASEVTDRYEELRFAGALDDAFRAPSTLSSRARELHALCRSLRATLAGRTYDDVDLFGQAIAGIEMTGAPDLGAVIVYLPERARPIELAFLSSLGSRGALSVLVAVTGDQLADELGDELARRLAATLGVSVAPSAPHDEQGGLGPDRLLLAANPRNEVRAAIRLLLEGLEQGSDPERMALVYAARDPYLRLAVAELNAAGIVCSAPSPDALAAEAPGRVLLALVELLGGVMRRDSLMRLLRSAPLVDASGQSVPVEEWDRASRLLGMIEGSPGEWVARLSDFARRQASEDAEEVVAPDDDAAPRPSSELGRDALAAAGLADFVADLGSSLRAGAAANGWRELATWCQGCLDVLLGPPSARLNWPAQASAALDAYGALLSELATLDQIEPGVTAVDLGARLGEELRRPGPRLGTLGIGVVVGPLDQLIGMEVDLAVVLGASASNLPAGAARSPLLEGSDREQLGLDPLSPGATAVRARRQVALVRRAANEFVATAPALDSSGRQVVVSRLVSDAASTVVLPGELAALASVLDGAPARSAAELATAALFASSPTLACARAGALGLDEVAHRLGIVTLRDSGAFGAYSGLVGPSTAALAVTSYSPTSLEAIAVCPFRHFLDHVLACEALDEPERRIEIDPRDRGSIVHEVLERYIGGVIADDSTAGADRLAEIANEVIARYTRLGRTGKRVVFELERRKILEGLELERLADQAHRARSGERPIAVEHAFGFGATPPVVIEIAGRELSFRGKIDRLDVARDGSIVVIDYKTGRPRSFAGIEIDPVDGGRHLQLPIYALAARAHLDAPSASVRAAFRFVGPVPSEVGLELSEAIEDRLGDTLAVLTDSIVEGIFPMRPGESGFGGPENCRYCDFNSVCPPDRRRLFDQACESGLLDAYLELTEPLGPVGEEPELTDEAFDESEVSASNG